MYLDDLSVYSTQVSKSQTVLWSDASHVVAYDFGTGISDRTQHTLEGITTTRKILSPIACKGVMLWRTRCSKNES